MRLPLLAVASLLLLAASLFAQNRAAVPAAIPLAQAVPVMRVGDVFEMRLSGMPVDLASEFAVQYTVAQDGTVNVPLIGEMKAQGFTTNQIEHAVQAKLASDKIFAHPTVVINVLGGTRFVTIGGGVHAPQRIQWNQDLTLRTAIESAGGLDEFARKKAVRLIRDGRIVQTYDLRVLEKDPSQDPRLLPGDQVFVPKN